jgi:protein phosphatase
MRFALRTDTGRARENNEDCARAVPERGLFAIADGMGGHVAGEVASRVAVDAALEFLERCDSVDEQQLGRAAEHANAAVLREAAERGLWGMGTTLTLLCVAGGQGSVAHVGDTRAYLLGAQGLEQLTSDHTLIAELVREGLVAPEQARFHPERHVLLQALGAQAKIEPELRRFPLRPGARLLLSSDGLHDLLEERELGELAAQSDLDSAVEALIARANGRGGHDNITAILVEP